MGECARGEDIVVNVCKKKHVTNMRAAGSDEALRLTPATVFTLEQCLEFIADDELVEVTPKSIRMRKRYLTKEQRVEGAQPAQEPGQTPEAARQERSVSMETPYFQNPPQDGQEQARQQPVQGGGQPPQQQARPGSGKAVASLVLGIVALLCTFYSSLIVPGLLAIALAIIGLVLGVQARRALPQGATGMATAGMVLSIIALALGVLFTVSCAACVASLSAAPYLT